MRNIDWILLAVSLLSPLLAGATTWGMMRSEIRFLIDSSKDHESRLRILEARP